MCLWPPSKDKITGPSSGLGGPLLTLDVWCIPFTMLHTSIIVILVGPRGTEDRNERRVRIGWESREEENKAEKWKCITLYEIDFIKEYTNKLAITSNFASVRLWDQGSLGLCSVWQPKYDFWILIRFRGHHHVGLWWKFVKMKGLPQTYIHTDNIITRNTQDAGP